MTWKHKGFNIEVTSNTGEFQVFKYEGESMGHPIKGPTLAKADTLIGAQVEIENLVKRMGKGRDKLNLPVTTWKREDGTLTSVHAGSGNLLIKYSEPDTYEHTRPLYFLTERTADLIADFAEAKARVASLEEDLKGYIVPDMGYHRSPTMDRVLDLEEEIRQAWAAVSTEDA